MMKETRGKIKETKGLNKEKTEERRKEMWVGRKDIMNVVNEKMGGRRLPLSICSPPNTRTLVTKKF